MTMVGPRFAEVDLNSNYVTDESTVRLEKACTCLFTGYSTRRSELLLDRQNLLVAISEKQILEANHLWPTLSHAFHKVYLNC